MPSQLAVMENVIVLAKYASICQANSIKPIAKPKSLLMGAMTWRHALRHLKEFSLQYTKHCWIIVITWKVPYLSHTWLYQATAVKRNTYQNKNKNY